MLWLLVLHIIALLFWSAALLYLPVLIAGARHRELAISETEPRRHDSLARFVFTLVATPPALLAIIAGTLLFLMQGNTEPWLIVKLTLVAALVVCHALAGVLVLRLEETPEKPQQPWCALLSAVMILLMVAVTWLVLAKPPVEGLPWL